MDAADIAASASLTIEFRPRIDDYAEFLVHVDRTSPVARRRRHLLAAFVAVFSIGMAIWIATQPGRVFWFGASLLLGYIGLYLAWLLLLRSPLIRRSARRRMRDGTFRSFLAPTRLTASPAGIDVTNTYAHSTCAWSAISDLTVTAGAIYIFVTSMSAIIIPARAFPDEEAFAAFADALRRLHRGVAAASSGSQSDGVIGLRDDARQSKG